MPSSLTFPSTEVFRNALMTRNLAPYSVTGVYSPPSGPVTYEVNLSNYSVIDSDGNLILNDPYADLLYPLNTYGPDGGYDKNINVGGLANATSNVGEYDVMDASLPQQSYDGSSWPAYLRGTAQMNIPTLNRYSFEFVNLEFVRNIQFTPTFSFYANPTPISFLPSSYSPYSILLQSNPSGDNGSLSQDSFIAQLGAKTLKKEFEERIARNIYRNTLGRVNLDNAISDPVQAVQLIKGTIPLVERDWVITRPSNIIVEAADFALRLSGTYFPASPIPGDYFNENEGGLSTFGQIAAAFNGGKDPRGGFFGKLFGRFLSQKSPSQIFLNNTGGGQKSQLFYNLSFNRYGPDYDRGLLGEIGQGVRNLINNLLDKPTKGQYYVGSKILNPSRIDSPAGELPLDPWGREVQAPVYGPEKMAIDFETEDLKFKIGFSGSSSTDGGGISGGMVWTSPKYSNTGYRATIGGGQGSQTSDTESELSNFVSEDQLTNGFDFKTSSILDNTQRLLDSTPNGAKRLSHVGNAINQLSKVFNDGYKEITKGSKVIKYNDGLGVQVGTEYCRVFTKDTPYYTFNDLQKSDGNIRKFNFSVLDNTFNLNIAPLKKTSSSTSTNIKDGKVQKYMFSIENLAWRTSNRPGLTYSDLPDCEKGPNGGRIMWFPPYDLTFSENVTPSFDSNNFLGRPEPIFTYKNTRRSGQLSWKIIVDHPSILNVIVNKELNNMSIETSNSIIDSFFAGCKKYDLYELAKKYPTISFNDLSELQQKVNLIAANGSFNEESAKQLSDENPQGNAQAMQPNNQSQTSEVNKYVGIGFYFDKGGVKSNYENEYNSYIGKQSGYSSRGTTQEQKDAINTFFDTIIKYNFSEVDKLLNNLLTIFDGNKDASGNTYADVTITLEATVSEDQDSPQDELNSIIKYVESWNNKKLKPYIDVQKKLKIRLGTITRRSVNPKGSTINLGPFDCAESPSNSSYDTKYSPRAMACRSLTIASIDVQVSPNTNNKPLDSTQNTDTNKTPPGYKPGPVVAPNITVDQSLKEGISKRILRSLLSECNYFEMVEKDNPMFYSSIKDKIKHFSPAFHSTTPEGLNSRLTFLHQCTRPGDTIPVIGVDGKPKYTSSVNTSFGAPPVLVLRVGDFYNTKIIPSSLSISYEPIIFDFNPEGIGVQPMIAKISMNFDFVGGSGLKDPIDKLQNALSFNFYANTEMYDERADATDLSYQKFDQEIWDSLSNSTPSAGVNNVENKTNGGTTIGTVLTKTESTSGDTGDISYKKVMDDLISYGQKYFDTVVNKLEQISKDNNLTTYQLFTQNRNYSKGVAKEFTGPAQMYIYGKPNDTSTVLDSLYNQVIRDIDNVKGTSDNGLAYIWNLYSENFDNNTIKSIKENLKKLVKENRDSIATSLNSVNNDIVQSELELIKTMRKIDIVLTNTDGYIKEDKSVEIYNLTATTETFPTPAYGDTLAEMNGDYDLALNDINDFYSFLVSNSLIDVNVDINNLKKYANPGLVAGSCCLEAEKRFFALMSNVILDSNKYESFVTSLTAGVTSAISSGKKVTNYTERYFKDTRKEYQKEYDAQQKVIKDAKKSSSYTTFEKWKPYTSGKERKFKFSGVIDGTPAQVNYINNLWMEGNSNTDKTTFNGKNQFN